MITGEGKIDSQTVRGKAPAGVVRTAKQKSVPVVAFAGVLGEGAELLREEGVEALLPICKEGMTREEAMQRTQELLADEAERFALAWRAD